MNARAKKIFFAIICGCTASLANPTPLSQDIQPGTQKTAPPNGVVELLTRLKYAIDLCLIDNQTSLENLMGFKFYNSGGTKEDYAEYDGAHKSINGSWGGMVATREDEIYKSKFNTTKNIGFHPVFGGSGIYGASSGMIIDIFGNPNKIIPSNDFHRLGGDQYIYESIGVCKSSIYISFSSKSNENINHLYVRYNSLSNQEK